MSGTSVLADNWVLTFPPCSLRVFASPCGGLCVPSFYSKVEEEEQLRIIMSLKSRLPGIP